MPKILIVDDEPTIMNPCVTMMRALGYDIYGTTDSKGAFELMDRLKPDILVLDVNLREDVDGFDILKRGLEVNPEVRALMLTGGDTSADECARLGAKALLVKPVDLETFIQAVDRLVIDAGRKV